MSESPKYLENILQDSHFPSLNCKGSLACCLRFEHVLKTVCSKNGNIVIAVILKPSQAFLSLVSVNFK